jgi:glutathione S-transferase
LRYDVFSFARRLTEQSTQYFTCNAAIKKQKTATAPKLKLYYFNIPGKGEAIRLACAYGGIPLEDFRMHANEFHDLKVSGKLAFGQVPALEVNGSTMITQSAAIMRYVGKLTGLYPTGDDLYAAKIDMIVDSENDLFMGLAVSRYRGTQETVNIFVAHAA